MFLERIEVNGYRSIADLAFDFNPFNVIVGPNNAGKSNFIRSIRFLSKIYFFGLDQAVDSEGGFENIASRDGRNFERNISFSSRIVMSKAELEGKASDSHLFLGLVTSSDEATGDSYSLFHQFTIRTTGEPSIGKFQIHKERLEIRALDEPDEPLLVVSRNRNKVDAPEISSLGRKLLFPYSPHPFWPIDTQREFAAGRSRFLLDFLDVPLSYTFSRFFGRTQLYDFLPSSCRTPSPPNPDGSLSEHGYSLPALVSNLQRRAPAIWVRIMSDMRRVLPGLDSIDVVKTYERLYSLAFVQGERSWLPDEVSDGTIRTLALLSVLFAPVNQIVLLEEPENSLHPWVLRLFSAASREVSSSYRKIVIATSHSPVLIDQLEPREILVASMHKGRTRIVPLLSLEPAVQVAWENGEKSLSTLIDVGWIPEAVPGFVE